MNGGCKLLGRLFVFMNGCVLGVCESVSRGTLMHFTAYHWHNDVQARASKLRECFVLQDFKRLNLSRFRHGGVNVTGFQLLDEQQAPFKDLRRTLIAMRAGKVQDDMEARDVYPLPVTHHTTSSVCLSVFLSVCVSFCFSVCLSVCWPACLSFSVLSSLTPIWLSVCRFFLFHWWCVYL